MPRAMALRDPPDAPAEPICGIPAVPATPTTGCFETGSVIPDVPAPAGRSVDPRYQPRWLHAGRHAGYHVQVLLAAVSVPGRLCVYKPAGDLGLPRTTGEQTEQDRLRLPMSTAHPIIQKELDSRYFSAKREFKMA
jgi:hypothetical protein